MPDDNVTPFPGITRLDLDPDTLLEEAKGGLDSVVIIGFQKDGHEYFAASCSDGADTVWHLQRAIHKLMRTADKMMEEE